MQKAEAARLNAGSPSSTDVLNAVKNLAANQEKLGQVFNKNMSLVSDSFLLVDGHQFTIRAILMDLVKGRVWAYEDGGELCYEWYFEIFNQLRRLEMMVQFLAATQPVESSAPAAEEPQVVQEAPPEPSKEDFTFGGDYAPQIIQ